MKKIVFFLLAVFLILSLSVFSFASPQIIPVYEGDDGYVSPFSGIVPYSLVNPTGNIAISSSGTTDSSIVFTSLIDDGNGLFVGSGGVLTSLSSSSIYNNLFYIGRLNYIPTGSDYSWINFVGKIIDANGYVLQASDFNNFGVRVCSNSNLSANIGHVTPASDNIYQFSDGFLQISISQQGWSYSNAYPLLYCNVSNSSVVAPLSFQVETFDYYSNEASGTTYPFTFGSGAHTVVPDTPVEKDPNDHSQYGSASDQVEWYNDAYGSAVDPELEDKMSATTDMLLQEQEIEEQMISGIEQYAPSVDPANLTMPTQIVNGIRFIGTTFMGSYNALGDIGFVISFSMMLGVVLVLIGRGEGALARGIAASARERRRTEYASDRDMKKGG